MTKVLSAPSSTAAGEPFEADDLGPRHGLDEVEIGQWYWVTDTVKWEGSWTDDDDKPLKKGEEVKWLGCVMQVGSNYIELHSPPYDRSCTTTRVHFDEFEKRLKFAEDADKYIAEQQVFYKGRVNMLLGEVKTIMGKLGIVPTQMLADRSGENQNALAVVSSRPDTTAYKKALIKAEKETLPALFKQIENANKGLARWMTASTLPLTATIGPMQESIGAIKDRVYTIELYAGLTEEAVKCRDGKPAALTEKLRVMQRRLYMDEESLANYTAGGMEFKGIGAFDKWLSKPENRDRLLPFPRTLVAFRVRRNAKHREHGGSISNFINIIGLEDADKKTFLYVRNGEQVWRVDCDFEFDEMILPNKEQFNPSEPMMVHMRFERIEDMMPRKRWEALVAEKKEQEKKSKAWHKANPGKHDFDNPFRENYEHRDLNQYEPLDQSSVEFDDAMKAIGEEIKRYNRIAVIVQGLFDRSEVLHPHAPVKMWDAESFNRSVELVYDAMTLTHGDKPDFEAFRAKLNILLDANSVVTGQQNFWMRREAERENKRQANDWRNASRTRSDYTLYAPYGNPGPGLIGTMAEWKARAKKAVFRWERDKRTGYRETVPASIEVPISALFNVSAYKPGDFKQFFADPRTRVEYLKWAPLLLVAEDWHAGKHQKFKISDSHKWEE